MRHGRDIGHSSLLIVMDTRRRRDVHRAENFEPAANVERDLILARCVHDARSNWDRAFRVVVDALNRSEPRWAGSSKNYVE